MEQVIDCTEARLKRNPWRMIVAAIAPAIVRVQGKREQRQETDAICQSSVVASHANAVYVRALIQARAGGDCEPVTNPAGSPWGRL